ncbi:hypothetical protein [Curtobacterium sp. MCBD17_040]|uniref:hypothetical protein n=1 Tax=Curtobacterium sp. MCBD17_040 TaxID=2175674 RepID=UPI0024DFD996|nr:hypothetical protein [Curtobacterium sp. MCBD17_040]WIB65817.1 hypothetical protein DEI94_17025 [Curtobacterium sp. MCBD17_040]
MSVVVLLLLTVTLPGRHGAVGVAAAWVVLCVLIVGAMTFATTTVRVRALRSEVARARSAVHLADGAVRDAERRLADATEVFWAKKRPQAA